MTKSDKVEMEKEIELDEALGRAAVAAVYDGEEEQKEYDAPDAELKEEVEVEEAELEEAEPFWERDQVAKMLVEQYEGFYLDEDGTLMVEIEIGDISYSSVARWPKFQGEQRRYEVPIRNTRLVRPELPPKPLTIRIPIRLTKAQLSQNPFYVIAQLMEALEHHHDDTLRFAMALYNYGARSELAGNGPKAGTPRIKKEYSDFGLDFVDGSAAPVGKEGDDLEVSDMM